MNYMREERKQETEAVGENRREVRRRREKLPGKDRAPGGSELTDPGPNHQQKPI